MSTATFHDKINDAPYDYFTATATLGLSSNQPLISKINLLGKLWGVPLKTSTGMEMMFGVFQHFNYFDSEEIINGSGAFRIKYRKLPVWAPASSINFHA